VIIGGLRKFSLIDYPGKTCAVIFTRGCNMRCPYCHNPELVWPEQYAPAIGLREVMQFLEARIGWLEAVTVSGGEPCLHANLMELLTQLKDMGFAVKLDSNGSFPQALRGLIENGLLDYVAMDIKAPLEKYAIISGVDLPIDPIRESVALLLEGRVDYEFRTTVDRALLNDSDLLEIGREIRGARRYYLQKLNAHNAKNPHAASMPDNEIWLRGMAEKLGQYVENCQVR